MWPTEMMKKSDYWCKIHKSYCFDNSHFVKVNRISFAFVAFFICTFKRKAMFLTRTCQGEDMNKGPLTLESFYLEKFFLVVSVEKLWQVSFTLTEKNLTTTRRDVFQKNTYNEKLFFICTVPYLKDKIASKAKGRLDLFQKLPRETVTG